MEIKRKPNWLRIAVSQGSNFTKTFETILSSGVNTVCQNAKCPNRSDCWSRGTATFMILGGAFAPAIGAFCAVGHGTPLGAQSRRTRRRCKCRGKTRPEMRRHHLGKHATISPTAGRSIGQKPFLPYGRNRPTRK